MLSTWGMMEGNPRSNYTGAESTVDYSPMDIRRLPLIHPAFWGGGFLLGNSA